MNENALHPEVAAIVRFLLEHFPSTVYVNEVPQDFKVPSFYVPPLASFGGGASSLSTYSKSYTLNLKLFHSNQPLAVSVAESLHDECERKRMYMPMIDDNGEEIDNFVRISRIDVRPGDGASATMVFQWSSPYQYVRPDYVNIENFTLEGGMKSE
ncbi:DUF6838 family protein [Alkalihalobacillus sp. FSL W8-0930]